MGNKIIVGGFLLLSFVSAYAELSYMDSIKSSIDANSFDLDRWNSQERKIDSDIIHTNSIPLYILGVNGLRSFGVKSEKLEKVIQYNAWYNPHHMLYALDSQGEFKRYNYGNRELLRKALIAEIAEPIIFLAADHTVEKLAGAVSETETGKIIAQAIPQQHHQFVKKNGKVLVSALVARGIGTVAKDESLSQNAKSFGQNAFVHLGSNTLEEYVINPQIDKLMGSEDSNTKECAKFAANGLAMYGLHVGLKMLGA